MNARNPVFAGNSAKIVGAWNGKLVHYSVDGDVIASRDVARPEPAGYVGVDDAGGALVQWGDNAVHFSNALEEDWGEPAYAAAIGPAGQFVTVYNTVQLYEADGSLRWTQPIPITPHSFVNGSPRWELAVTRSGDVLVYSSDDVALLDAATGTNVTGPAFASELTIRDVTTVEDDLVVALSYGAGVGESVRRIGRDSTVRWSTEFELGDYCTFISAVGVSPQGDVLALLDTCHVGYPQARRGSLARDVLLSGASGEQQAERERCSNWPSTGRGGYTVFGDLVAVDDTGFVVIEILDENEATLARYAQP